VVLGIPGKSKIIRIAGHDGDDTQALTLYLINSFFRSTILKNPFLFLFAISPVFNHPSLVIVSSVEGMLLR